MTQNAYNQITEFISNDLRLRTQPVAVSFLRKPPSRKRRGDQKKISGSGSPYAKE